MDPSPPRMNFFLFLIIVTATLTHSAPSPSPQPVAFRVGPLRFDRPESWRWVPPSGNFRAAQLEKKSPDGTPLTLTFSRFFVRRRWLDTSQSRSLDGSIHHLQPISYRNQKRFGRHPHPFSPRRHASGRYPGWPHSRPAPSTSPRSHP